MVDTYLSSLPYGIRHRGAHYSVKLRFKRALLSEIFSDPRLVKYRRELTFIFNKAGTHGHVVGVFHQNSEFLENYKRVVSSKS